jgi:hypothetical protein
MQRVPKLCRKSLHAYMKQKLSTHHLVKRSGMSFLSVARFPHLPRIVPCHLCTSSLCSAQSSDARAQKHCAWPLQTAAPRKVELWSKGLPVRIVACSGGGHDMMAIDENGRMWGCGRNVHGQLGFGNQESIFNMSRIPFSSECVTD